MWDDSEIIVCFIAISGKINRWANVARVKRVIRAIAVLAVGLEQLINVTACDNVVTFWQKFESIVSIGVCFDSDWNDRVAVQINTTQRQFDAFNWGIGGITYRAILGTIVVEIAENRARDAR